MRKLASIQQIIALTPIEGADNIECAQVLGWKCVVKKGEFKVGDLCVYCEIDSVLPQDNPYFEFMKPYKYRVRTIKLRKQISQGLCLPLSVLSNDFPTNEVWFKSSILGMDVSNTLGITKWKPAIPVQLFGKMVGMRPFFVPKTDEERIQAIPEVLQHPRATFPEWYITEKIDGTSFSAYVWDGYEHPEGVCSRNVQLSLDDEANSYVRFAKEAGIWKRIRDVLGSGYVVQGELIGSGIQKNKYKYPNNALDLFVFDIWDINNSCYLPYDKIVWYCDGLHLHSVPSIDVNIPLFDSVDTFVEYSKGESILNHNIQREGVVVRHLTSRTSFKVINPNFLLKWDE